MSDASWICSFLRGRPPSVPPCNGLVKPPETSDSFGCSDAWLRIPCELSVSLEFFSVQGIPLSLELPVSGVRLHGTPPGSRCSSSPQAFPDDMGKALPSLWVVSSPCDIFSRKDGVSAVFSFATGEDRMKDFVILDWDCCCIINMVIYRKL